MFGRCREINGTSAVMTCTPHQQVSCPFSYLSCPHFPFTFSFLLLLLRRLLYVLHLLLWLIGFCFSITMFCFVFLRKFLYSPLLFSVSRWLPSLFLCADPSFSVSPASLPKCPAGQLSLPHWLFLSKPVASPHL